MPGPYDPAVRRIALLCLLLAVTACGDGGDDVGDARAALVRDAAIQAGLDDAAADFLALAARGQTATYQATYPGPEDDTSIVVANRPPDRRIDVLDGDRIVEVQLVVDGEAFSCPRDTEADAILECDRTDAIVEPLGVFGPETIDSLATALAGRVDDYTFSVETSPIAGVEASCLVTNIRPGRERADLADSGTLCVSPQGALLRVAQGEELLEATDYTTDIPASTFVRPDQDDDK